MRSLTPRRWLLACCLLIPSALHAQDVSSVSLDSLLNLNVSTAAKYEQTVTEAPASVTIVTSEDIERHGYTSLAELLRTIRGFYVTNDHTVFHLGARGFNRMLDINKHVLFLLNGHSINERIYGSFMQIGPDFGFDLEMIERIEIVRGPGSALYGTGAMLAVVNIITKAPTTDDALNVNAEMGSYARRKATVRANKGFANGLHVSVTGKATDIQGQRLYFKEFDTPETNDGIANQLDWIRQYGGFASAMYKGWSLQGFINYNESGIPSGDYGSIFNDQAAQVHSHRSFLELKHERPFGLDKHLTVRGFYDHFCHQTFYPFVLNRINNQPGGINFQGLEILFSQLANWHEVGGELAFRWDLRPDNRLMIGSQVIHNYRADIGSKSTLRTGEDFLNFFDGNFPYQIYSFYAQDEYQIRPSLSLMLGLRQDIYSRAGSATTPRGALVFHPSAAMTFKLLYGEAFRAPSSFGVSYDSVVEGVKPNPDLKPEKIRTAEFIWEHHLTQRLKASLSLYRYAMRDLIGVATDPADSLAQFQNTDRVRATGIEVGINGWLNQHTRGYFSYSYQRTYQVDSHDHLTNSPFHLVKAGLSVDVFRYVVAATDVLYESGRLTEEGTKTDSYVLADVHLSSRLLFEHWQFSLRLRNVLDTTYRLPSGPQHEPNSFLQNDRSIILRLTFTL